MNPVMALCAADAYDEIVEGDQALMDIYRWTEDEMTLSVRGATGSSDGAHIMTGVLFPGPL